MALTDTFVKNIKHSGLPVGNKHSDGQEMFLHVKEAGKYWRMNYRFLGKQKTLALGVYPEVSLAKARKRRETAREQLADGIDPNTAKRDEKQAKVDAAANTFEAVTRDWLTKTAAKRAEVTQTRVTTLLEKDVFPFIGKTPISTIRPRDILDKSLRKIELRGSIDIQHTEHCRYRSATWSKYSVTSCSTIGERAAATWTHGNPGRVPAYVRIRTTDRNQY